MIEIKNIDFEYKKELFNEINSPAKL
jgi:hypothetical protein